MDEERIKELVKILNANAQTVFHLIRQSGNRELYDACGPLLLGLSFPGASSFGIWDVADELEDALVEPEEDDTDDEEDEDVDEAEATLA